MSTLIHFTPSISTTLCAIAFNFFWGLVLLYVEGADLMRPLVIIFSLKVAQVVICCACFLGVVISCTSNVLMYIYMIFVLGAACCSVQLRQSKSYKGHFTDICLTLTLTTLYFAVFMSFLSILNLHLASPGSLLLLYSMLLYKTERHISKVTNLFLCTVQETKNILCIQSKLYFGASCKEAVNFATRHALLSSAIPENEQLEQFAFIGIFLFPEFIAAELLGGSGFSLWILLRIYVVFQCLCFACVTLSSSFALWLATRHAVVNKQFLVLLDAIQPNIYTTTYVKSVLMSYLAHIRGKVSVCAQNYNYNRLHASCGISRSSISSSSCSSSHLAEEERREASVDPDYYSNNELTVISPISAATSIGTGATNIATGLNASQSSDDGHCTIVYRHCKDSILDLPVNISHLENIASLSSSSASTRGYADVEKPLDTIDVVLLSIERLPIFQIASHEPAARWKCNYGSDGAANALSSDVKSEDRDFELCLRPRERVSLETTKLDNNNSSNRGCSTNIKQGINAIPAIDTAAILRAIAGLSEIEADITRSSAKMQLHLGAEGSDSVVDPASEVVISLTTHGIPLWRSHILYIPRDFPVLPGTPVEFLMETFFYKSRGRTRSAAISAVLYSYCLSMETELMLPGGSFLQQWSALSCWDRRCVAIGVSLILAKATQVNTVRNSFHDLIDALKPKAAGSAAKTHPLPNENGKAAYKLVRTNITSGGSSQMASVNMMSSVLDFDDDDGDSKEAKDDCEALPEEEEDDDDDYDHDLDDPSSNSNVGGTSSALEQCYFGRPEYVLLLDRLSWADSNDNYDNQDVLNQKLAAVERAIVTSGIALLLCTHDDSQAKRLVHRRVIISPDSSVSALLDEAVYDVTSPNIV